MSIAKRLFWNSNDSIVKLMFSITSVFLCDADLAIKTCQIMTMTTNAENLRKYKRLSLIAEQILAFPSSTNLVRKVMNLSPNFKLIA